MLVLFLEDLDHVGMLHPDLLNDVCVVSLGPSLALHRLLSLVPQEMHVPRHKPLSVLPSL